MARHRSIQGICHLCGAVGPLTFEHVPPKKAFNNRRTIRLNFLETLALGPDAPIRGKTHQGGTGNHTLCHRCNNDTGAWYAPALIEWCYHGMDIVERSGGRPELIYVYQCYPLRILKQILTMFCSVSGPSFTEAQPWLRRYLLNRESRDFNDSFRVFVYYNLGPKFRYAGISGMMDVDTGEVSVFSEITYPPFGYVLTIDSAPPDKRLVEITFFRRYLFSELARLEISLPVLPSHLAYPGDYRLMPQILADRVSNAVHVQEPLQ
jgi:hypothetical protein